MIVSYTNEDATDPYVEEELLKIDDNNNNNKLRSTF